jgi:hypothetical protein
MIRVARAAIAVVIIPFAVAIASANPAWALCPNCLAQRQTLTPTLELFLLVPFAVAAIAIGAVRRALYGRLAGAPSVVPPSGAPSAPPSSPGGDQRG